MAHEDQSHTGDRPRGSRAHLWVLAQIPLLAATIALPVIQVLVGQTSAWPETVLWPARVVGMSLVVTSALTFRAAASALGPDLVATPRPVGGSSLRDRGIYGRVRHPIYLAITMGTVGWALLWSSTVGLILSACCVGFFLLKTRYEEALLLQHFPGYVAYRQHVPAFVPRTIRLSRGKDRPA